MTIMSVVDGREIPVEQRLQEILAHLAALHPGDNLILITPHEPSRLLRTLIVELPNRLMWAPLEQGPEAWRWHFAGRNPAKSCTVSEYLCWDHRRLELILTDTTGLARANEWSDARCRMSEYAVGLRRHADIEDAILFPAYDEATGAQSDGPVMLMLSEHRDVRFSIDRLERAITAQDLDATEEALSVLLDVTEQHHAKEEEIIFPGMDASLDALRATQLVERLLLG